MWVLTSDGKDLIDASYFKIQKNLGSKDQKYAIVAYSMTTASVTMSGAVCAYFPDENKAKDELDKVIAFLEENPGKVYKFSK
ncbi:MAG: hypothetical protein K2J79_11060 [Ruminiclostridium sp.]|nr:hypothetical protein [Ruminiclostridium sp.]